MEDVFTVQLKASRIFSESVYLKCRNDKHHVFFAMLILSLKDCSYLFRFDVDGLYAFVDTFCERLALVGVDVDRCDSNTSINYSTVYVDELLYYGLLIEKNQGDKQTKHWREPSYYSDSLYKALNSTLPQSKRFSEEILSGKLVSPSFDLFYERDFIGSTFRFISPSGTVDFVCERQVVSNGLYSAEGYDQEGARVLVRAFGHCGFFFVKYDSLGDVDFTSKTGQLFLVTD